jgi:carboxymethylenebutenolidase
VESSTIDVPAADGTADAYLTRPDDRRRHPGVLLLIDAYGLRPRIEEMADRIAAAGYIVLAPNLFYRAGRSPVVPVPDMTDPDSRAAFWPSIRPLMAALTPERIEHDGGAYLDYLEQITSGPFAITGYCMGARQGWRIAAGHPGRIAALGCFHGGGFVTDAPDSPHLSARQLTAELYFGHADQDGSNTPEQIAALEAALDAAGVPYRSEIYKGALHGYTMSDTPAYDEASTERHFSELFGLFERTLDGPDEAP